MAKRFPLDAKDCPPLVKNRFNFNTSNDDFELYKQIYCQEYGRRHSELFTVYSLHNITFDNEGAYGDTGVTACIQNTGVAAPFMYDIIGR